MTVNATDVLRQLREFCVSQRDEWRRDAKGQAPVVVASCTMAAGSFVVVIEKIDEIDEMLADADVRAESTGGN